VTAESGSHEEYQLGLALYQKKQWKAAARHFGQADSRASRDDVFQQLYRSYHGLSLLYGGDVSGLNLCRHAAGVETIQAHVFLNLALAELKMRHRKRACHAVQLGLKIDPRDKELRELRTRMGMRRRPSIPFLKRESLLNKWLGKITYRRLKRDS